jgi:spermidine synthase
LRVGVIGLGTGTIAAYCRPGDAYRFYEINPAVEELCRQFFTYLRDAGGDVEVVLGDGRVSIEREVARGGLEPLDVLAIDAFSGDAIPVHLLTEEAFELYWKRLRPDGVLAVHVTNFHLDLSPVVRVLAAELGKRAVLVANSGDTTAGTDSSDWVLVTGNEGFLAAAAIQKAVTAWEHAEPRPIHWSDDYSNLLHVIY